MRISSNDAAVLLLTSDVFFRAKLDGLLRAAGATVVENEPAQLAVLELSGDDPLARIRALAERGVAVIAFAPHVKADLLRDAREAGAIAVPNSKVEEAVSRWLAERRR